MNVVICDDHRLFSDALATVFEARQWNVVGVTTHPDQAAATVADEPTDVCLMDLMYPAGHLGVEGIASVHRASPNTKVIVLTASGDAQLLVEAMHRGADGIVFKDDDIDQIISVVQRVHHGTGEPSRPEPRRFPTNARQTREGHDLARFLTDREYEILQHLVQGRSGKQLASEMGIAYSTVRTHVQNILIKLGVHSRLEAVAFAVEHGLCAPGPDTTVQARLQYPNGSANGSSGSGAASSVA